MDNSFKIMLRQCEKQAEKLTKLDVDDEFLAELDIFDNYFSQLRQIIENSDASIKGESTAKLKSLMDIFAKKMQAATDKLSHESKTGGEKKTILNYGQSKAVEAVKFDVRS